MAVMAQLLYMCSTVVMYFDIYIGVCHPLIVYTMYVEFNGVIIMKEKF